MRILFVVVLNLFLSGTALRAQDPEFWVDQRHDRSDVDLFGHNIQLAGVIIQEFVPERSSLNVVELWTEDFGSPRSNGLGASLQLLIRGDTAGGPIIAASNPLDLEDNHNGITRFEFSELVQVTPGNRYAIDLIVHKGDFWGVRSYGGAELEYLPGRYFRGAKTSDLDLWFRTGLSVPLEVRFVPPNRIEWIGTSTQSYRIWGSKDMVRWEEIASIESEPGEFTYLTDLEENHYFYRVSTP